jgi:integrase
LKREREAALPLPAQEEAVEAFIATQAPTWRKRYAVAQFRAPFVKWIYLTLGAMDVRAIEVPHVVAALKRVWTERPYTSQQLRARIESILEAAGAAGHRDRNLSNPAKLKGNIEFLLPQIELRRTHYRRPELDDAPVLYRTIAAAEGTAFAAWTFMILTTCRPGEAVKAVWPEIDLAKRLWIIPAARMKSKRQHIIPLSTAALAVLEGQAARRSGPDPSAVSAGPIATFSDNGTLDPNFSSITVRANGPPILNSTKTRNRGNIVNQLEFELAIRGSELPARVAGTLSLPGHPGECRQPGDLTFRPTLSSGGTSCA